MTSVQREKGEKMEMDYTCNMAVNEPRETAKSILENMDAILKELSAELRRIENAIYAPKPIEDAKEAPDECLLETLNRQRNTAEQLLKLAVHIREGLW